MRDGAVEEEVDDMQEVRGSDPCNGGDITYFSRELWWIFVRSPLSLVVNLHNFTAFTAFHRKITYEICEEKTNFSLLILRIFAFFSRPGIYELFRIFFFQFLNLIENTRVFIYSSVYLLL